MAQRVGASSKIYILILKGSFAGAFFIPNNFTVTLNLSLAMDLNGSSVLKTGLLIEENIMKLLLGLMSVLMALSVQANSGETKYFNIDSSIDSVEAILHGEKTHTEYRTRTYADVCYRTETTYRTICTNPPRPYPPRPYPGPRPRYLEEPNYRPGPVCQTVPHTRTVAYSCTKTERVPYQVKDYDVEARVSINVVNAHEFGGARGVVSAHLHGDSLYLKANSFKNYFVMIKDIKSSSQIVNGTKYMDVDYELELLEATPILSTLSLGSLKVQDNGLNFEIGKLADIEHLSFKLKIVQNKLFGSDPTLINRTLMDHEFELTEVGSKTLARVDFSRLNLDVRGGKFNITAAVEFKNKNRLLNESEFPNLTASRTLTYKAR